MGSKKWVGLRNRLTSTELVEVKRRRRGGIYFFFFEPAICSLIAACAAANLAIGTRYGEQLT
jgi:hypothetical protein